MSSDYEQETDKEAQAENDSVRMREKEEKNKLISILEESKRNKKLSAKTAMEAKEVIENTDIMQVITSKEVMEILSCHTTKARTLLKTMESQEVIK